MAESCVLLAINITLNGRNQSTRSIMRAHNAHHAMGTPRHMLSCIIITICVQCSPAPKDSISRFCSVTAKFIPKSNYERNLLRLFKEIPNSTTSSSSIFVEATVGEILDPANAMAFYRRCSTGLGLTHSRHAEASAEKRSVCTVGTSPTVATVNMLKEDAVLLGNSLNRRMRFCS